MIRAFLFTLCLTLAAAAGAADHPWPNDRLLGKADAPITIIEYSSLTCSHCAHFAAEAMPRVRKELIETGKVRWIQRDFPRDPLDQAASMIAQCAGDRYFAFSDSFLQSQANWLQAREPLAALKGIARLGGMTGEMVDQCLANRPLLEQLNARREEGRKLYDITATPTFVINGKATSDVGSYEDLLRLLK
jgi:protein-disulfide isomerase